MKFTLTLVLAALAATANAAMIKEKRLFPAPAPTIPAGLEATDSGCFDAGGESPEQDDVDDQS